MCQCQHNQQNFCRRYLLPVENGAVKVLADITPKRETLRVLSGEYIEKTAWHYELRRPGQCKFFQKQTQKKGEEIHN